MVLLTSQRARYYAAIGMGIILFVILAGALPVYAADCTSSGSGLQNPLKFCTIQEFIEGALKAIVIIALPILALFIVYSGFLFVMARGNAEQLSTARRNFAYVVIGGLLILGAWMLANLIGNTVSEIVG